MIDTTPAVSSVTVPSAAFVETLATISGTADGDLSGISGVGGSKVELEIRDSIDNVFDGNDQYWFGASLVGPLSSVT